MAAVPATTTLDAYHAAVVESMRATFGARIATYGAYDPAELIDPTQPLNTPALYLQIEASDLDDPPDRQPLRGRVVSRQSAAVHVILSTRTDGDLQVALDVLASAVGVLICRPDTQSHAAAKAGNRWGLGDAVSSPERISTQPAGWKPGLNGYDSRVVRFEQVAYLPNDPIACLAEPPAEPDPDPTP